MTTWIRAVVTAGVLLIGSAAVFAQGVSVQMYIVPKIGDGTPHANPFRAKYFDDDPNSYAGGTGLSPSPQADMVDYGLEPIMLVAANVDTAQDAFLSAQPDVIKIPSGLDSAPSSINLTALKSQLEALKIPAGWINATHTYRNILREVRGLFAIYQRYAFYNQGALYVGITLDSTVSQIPTAKRTALLLACADLGIDTSGIAGGMTIRAALRALYVQLPPMSLLGISFS